MLTVEVLPGFIVLTLTRFGMLFWFFFFGLGAGLLSGLVCWFMSLLMNKRRRCREEKE